MARTSLGGIPPFQVTEKRRFSRGLQWILALMALVTGLGHLTPLTAEGNPPAVPGELLPTGVYITPTDTDGGRGYYLSSLEPGSTL
jgi:hypothetical protein